MKLLVLIILSLLSTSAISSEKSPDDFTHETSNYLVISYINEDFTVEVGEKAERIFGEYSARFPELERKNHDLFTIKIFADKAAFDELLPHKAIGVTGMFSPSRRIIATFVGERETSKFWATLKHELFHHFAYTHIGADIPHWVNEGFAEYFAEGRWEGDKFHTGQLPESRINVVQNAIKNNSHIPFAPFFRKGKKRWLSARLKTEVTSENLHYSQAWSIIHFLLHAEDGRYEERLNNYIGMLADGEKQHTAFKQNFGPNIFTMERTWMKYVKDLEGKIQ